MHFWQECHRNDVAFFSVHHIKCSRYWYVFIVSNVELHHLVKLVSVAFHHGKLTIFFFYS